MIGLDGEKMSKSKGNLVFVSSLLASGVDPFVIRWSLMSHQYREDRMWSDEKLTESTTQVGRLRSALAQKDVAPTTDLIERILHYISDDLNTESVIDSLNDWADKTLDGVTGGDSSQLRKVVQNLFGYKS
jgi:L-cysteine:1D-myo-inositol 2-amino-2-deoxy-alpha-D-glucopyranoside ligase